MIRKNVDWGYYDKFEGILDNYLPARGEGETRATQAVTAVNKLVYKWYNDGDVFDNTHYMEGWRNDLSSYANWLSKHCGCGFILEGIAKCYTDADYEWLLKNLADYILDFDVLVELNKSPKIGSIYNCDGEFEYKEPDEDWDY